MAGSVHPYPYLIRFSPQTHGIGTQPPGVFEKGWKIREVGGTGQKVLQPRHLYHPLILKPHNISRPLLSIYYGHCGKTINFLF
jgi:hypothetical protein